MKLPRRKFLRLATGVAALPALSRVTWAQSYPTRMVRNKLGYKFNSICWRKNEVGLAFAALRGFEP